MKKTVVTLLFASLALGTTAQTENPRGIYKMATLTGKVGEVIAPFEQYKICTDSLTLMVAERNGTFVITDNDHCVFNYTGEQPKTDGDKGPLIYDSGPAEFKLKWWSPYVGHLYFPKDDWCIEKYVSGQYSAKGRIFFDALTGKPEADKSNPLIGTWRFIGFVDELHDMGKVLPKLRQDYPSSKYYNSFMVFLQKHVISISARGGRVDDIYYDGRKGFRSNNTNTQTKWLSKDCVAVEFSVDYRTDWMILERVVDGSTPLSAIAGQYVANSR